MNNVPTIPALQAANAELRRQLALREAELDAARRDAAWLREKLKTPVAPRPAPHADADRVAVFVETQSLSRFPVDYRDLLDRAVGHRRLGRASAYVVEVSGTDPAPLKQRLRTLGYQVRSRPGWDASVWTTALGDDLRDAARTCGRIVVATAHAELAGALAQAAALGSQVALASFDGLPAVLRAAAGEFLPLGA